MAFSYCLTLSVLQLVHFVDGFRGSGVHRAFRYQDDSAALLAAHNGSVGLSMYVSQPPGYSLFCSVEGERAACHLLRPDGVKTVITYNGHGGFPVLSSDGYTSEVDFGLIMVHEGDLWDVVFSGFTDSRYNEKILKIQTHTTNNLILTFSATGLKRDAWQTVGRLRWIFDRTQQERREAPVLLMVPWTGNARFPNSLLFLEIFPHDPRLKATVINEYGLALTYQTKELLAHKKISRYSGLEDFRDVFAWFFPVFDTQALPQNLVPCNPCYALVSLNAADSRRNVQNGGEYFVRTISFQDWQDKYGEPTGRPIEPVLRFSYLRTHYSAKFEGDGPVLYPLDDRQRIAQKLKDMYALFQKSEQDPSGSHQHSYPSPSPAAGLNHGEPGFWESAFSNEHNRNYHFNRATGESRWENPAASASQSSKEDGPRWESAFSVGHNRVYYFNRATGESRWDNPENPVAHGSTPQSTEYEPGLPSPMPDNVLQRHPLYSPELQLAYDALDRRDRMLWILGFDPRVQLSTPLAAELKRKWKHACLQSHPDKTGLEVAKDIFQDVMKAYEYFTG